MPSKLTALHRIILLGYAAAVIAACVFVPWKGDFQATRATLGYAFLWEPPEHSEFRNFVVVDFERVVLEIVALTGLGGMVFLVSDSLKSSKLRPKVPTLKKEAL
jgi:hypothetical protein